MNFALIVLFLAGCSKAPPEDIIETAIVYTQAAQPTEKHTDMPHPETRTPSQLNHVHRLAADMVIEPLFYIPPK
jgi:hypothetical protein